MSFRFWRRVRLAPGVTLNLSKTSASLSLGPRGASYTISPRGNRATVGLPGTGLFYTVKAPGGGAADDRPRAGGRRALDLGFFRRLVTPAAQRAFVDGLRALNEGQADEALARLEQAGDTPDAAWMAGMLRLKREDLAQAQAHLARALAGEDKLGQLYAEYGLDSVVTLPVTPEVTAHLRPCSRGTALALAEAYQLQGQGARAVPLLQRILAEDPGDIVAIAALAELLLAEAQDPAAAQEVVRMTAQITNETSVHAAALLYKARALSVLGLDEAAVTTLTTAWRRKKDRPAELLRQIRYDRALAYGRIGRRSRARQELQAIYAEAPDFEDVAQRLGL